MKQIFIFLSSTFEDMQSERDLSKKIVVPDVNERLAPYGYNIECIDLRWGIDTNNVEKEECDRKVLRSCFSEIQKSKPYFVAFIGEKYGWVPNSVDVSMALYSLGLDIDDFTGKSVTEMEIIYALSKYSDLSKMIFYIRNEVDFGDDEYAKNKFVSKGTDKDKLDKLKRFIKENYPNQCFEYNAKWDKKKRKFILEDDFETRIIEDIYKNVADKNDFANDSTEYDKNKYLFQNICNRNNSMFDGRIDELNEIEQFIKRSNKKLLLVKGESGIGKSFILSKVIEKYSIENNLYYFCGINDETSTLDDLMNYMIYQLDNTFTNEKIEFQDKLNLFGDLINDYAKDKKILIVIDAINQLTKNKKIIQFLNTFLYNENIKFIVSTTPNYPYLKDMKVLDFDCLEVAEFSISDAQKIFNKYFISAHKEKLNSLTNYLFSKKKSKITDPIYLSLVIQKLENLSINDFQKIYEKKEKENISFSDSLEGYLKELINEFGESSEELLLHTSSLIEKEVPNSRLFFDLISFSQKGITKDLIEFVFNKLNIAYYPASFSTFLKLFKTFTVEYSDGQYRFNHGYVNEFFYKRIDYNQNIAYNKLFAEYYENKKDTYYQLYFVIKSKSVEDVLNLVNKIGKDKDFIKRLGQIINKEDDKVFIKNLLNKDKDLFLTNALYRAIYYGYINYDNASEIIKIIKNTYSMKDKIGEYYRYCFDMAFAFSAYRAKNYKLVSKIVDKSIKEQKLHFEHKLFGYLNVGYLVLKSKLKLGKVNKKEISAVLEGYYSEFEKENDTNIKTKKLLVFLNKLRSIYSLCLNTTYKNNFIDYSIVEYLKNIYYQDILKEDNKIIFLIDTFNYLSSSNYMCIFTLKEELDEIDISNIQFIKEAKNEIELLSMNTEIKKELRSNILMALSKFHDNVFIEDNNNYSLNALSLSKEIVKENVSEKNVSKYIACLNHYVDQQEMIGNRNVEKSLELLSLSKQLVELNPSTQSFDILENSFDKCQRFGLVDKKEYLDYFLLKSKREKVVKVEVSKEKITKRRYNLFKFAGLSLIFIALMIFTYIYENHMIKIGTSEKIVNRMMEGLRLGVVLGMLTGFGLSNSLRYIISYLSNTIIKKDVVIFVLNIFALLISLISTIVFIGWSMPEDIELLMYRANGTIAYFFILTIFLTIVLSRFFENLVPSTSDIENYYKYVINYNNRKKYYIISSIIVLCINSFSVIVYFERIKMIKDLSGELFKDLDILGIAVSIVLLLLSLLVFIGKQKMKKDDFNKYKKGVN